MFVEGHALRKLNIRLYTKLAKENEPEENLQDFPNTLKGNNG